MRPAARITDLHMCSMTPPPGLPIIPPTSLNVIICGLPAARVTDRCLCVGPPPANVDVRNLEPLGNIAGADLGPRDGGCTFAAGENPLLLAGALNDPASSGKAVVRAGGKLYLLGSAPGGMPAIRQGSRFTGEGVTVDVTPTAGQAAVLKVTDAQGRSANISGTWVCA